MWKTIVFRGARLTTLHIDPTKTRPKCFAWSECPGSPLVQCQLKQIYLSSWSIFSIFSFSPPELWKTTQNSIHRYYFFLFLWALLCPQSLRALFHCDRLNFLWDSYKLSISSKLHRNKLFRFTYPTNIIATLNHNDTKLIHLSSAKPWYYHKALQFLTAVFFKTMPSPTVTLLQVGVPCWTVYADVTIENRFEVYFIQQSQPRSISLVKTFVRTFSLSSFSLVQRPWTRSGTTRSKYPYLFSSKKLLHCFWKMEQFVRLFTWD